MYNPRDGFCVYRLSPKMMKCTQKFSMRSQIYYASNNIHLNIHKEMNVTCGVTNNTTCTQKCCMQSVKVGLRAVGAVYTRSHILSAQ